LVLGDFSFRNDAVPISENQQFDEFVLRVRQETKGDYLGFVPVLGYRPNPPWEA
jgi:hypothetical protein